MRDGRLEPAHQAGGRWSCACCHAASMFCRSPPQKSSAPRRPTIALRPGAAAGAALVPRGAAAALFPSPPRHRHFTTAAPRAGAGMAETSMPASLAIAAQRWRGEGGGRPRPSEAVRVFRKGLAAAPLDLAWCGSAPTAQPVPFCLRRLGRRRLPQAGRRVSSAFLPASPRPVSPALGPASTITSLSLLRQAPRSRALTFIALGCRPAQALLRRLPRDRPTSIGPPCRLESRTYTSSGATESLLLDEPF